MRILNLVALAAVGLSVVMWPMRPAGAEVLKVMEGSSSEPLNVPMNRAVVLESETPFSEFSIANPGSADISTLSDKSIYVLGKTPGRTTMTLLSAEGKLIANVDVHVTPDIAEFKERLQQILPGEKIEVRTANDGIVLSGMAAERLFTEALTYDPSMFTAKNNLVLARGAQRKYDLPVVPMDQTERAELMYTLALTAIKQNDLAVGKALLSDAIETHPQYFEAAVRSLAALEG